MAVYKVPQDVEAEDKLVGPFSFRQFIYLLIAGGAGGLSVLFFNAPMPVPFFSIITIPIVIGFVVLALPLRKDQPMEIYLIAVLRFMFKPKKRLWMNDGTSSMVVIDAPRVVQRQLSKDITQEEALDKLSYLSKIVDTRGWAAKGVDVPHDTSVAQAVADDARSTQDVLDENTGLAKSFDSLIAKQKEASRKEAIEHMHEIEKNKPRQPASTGAPQVVSPSSYATGSNQPQSIPSDTNDPKLQFNPYPSMHQHVLNPRGAPPQPAPISDTSVTQNNQKQTADKSMTPPVSPDIIRLANNNDLSIQAIANEARRISEHDENEEVVIKLH